MFREEGAVPLLFSCQQLQFSTRRYRVDGGAPLGQCMLLGLTVALLTRLNQQRRSNNKDRLHLLTTSTLCSRVCILLQ